MSSLSVRLHDKVRELARRDGVSINQFIATAVAEKASALLTVDYLEQRARRADPDLLTRLLSRVPDVPPLPGDELPGDWQPPASPNPRKRSRGGSARRRTSVRRLDGEVIRRLKIRARRYGLSVEETVRRILADAVVDEEPVGAMIRRIIGDEGIDLELPAREVEEPIDFTSAEYGPDDPE